MQREAKQSKCPERCKRRTIAVRDRGILSSTGWLRAGYEDSDPRRDFEDEWNVDRGEWGIAGENLKESLRKLVKATQLFNIYKFVTDKALRTK